MRAETIFIDTNLFLRFLTNDVPEKAEAFERILKDASAGKVSLITNAMVIAEIVWTLESYYKVAKADIQHKVMAILNTIGLQVMDEEIILQAIIWFVDKNIDYIDAFNAAWMIHQKIGSVYTFDRKHFARLESLTVLIPGTDKSS